MRKVWKKSHPGNPPYPLFLRLIRGIVLRGAGIAELLPEVGALLAFAGVMLTVAVLRFRKRLD